MPLEEICHHCNKGPGDRPYPICAKCKDVKYCSRECQKAAWKSHKKICGKATGDPQIPDQASASGGLDRRITKPFTKLDSKTWLHNRTEKDTYRLLIEAYRFRVEDDVKMQGEADADSIHGNATDVRRGFKRFIEKAESRRGLLPSWWDATKKEECEEFGMGEGHWYELKKAKSKDAIIQHYGGDDKFPMQLRMFAEQVLGTGPGGQPGAAMMGMMKAMEGGEMDGMYMSHLKV